MTRGRRSSSRSRRARGFTLIELLVAAALLAVLAVLSWRGLDAVLESRRRIVAASDELRSLSLAFAQLDEDLRRSWPVRLLRLRTPSIGFTVSGDQAVATLELLREATGPAEPTQVQRVAWRLRDGVLERGFGRVLAPALADLDGAGAGVSGVSGGATGSDAGGAALAWQPILAGVAQLQWQGWVTGQGWIGAEALVGQLRGPGNLPGNPQGNPTGNARSNAPGNDAAPASGQAAVTGLMVRIVRADGGVLQRILPVKD